MSGLKCKTLGLEQSVIHTILWRCALGIKLYSNSFLSIATEVVIVSICGGKVSLLDSTVFHSASKSRTTWNSGCDGRIPTQGQHDKQRAEANIQVSHGCNVSRYIRPRNAMHRSITGNWRISNSVTKKWSKVGGYNGALDYGAYVHYFVTVVGSVRV